MGWEFKAVCPGLEFAIDLLEDSDPQVHIWKMEAVTLARGHVTRAKEENTRKLFKRNSHVNHRTFRGRRKLSQISER